MKLSFKNPFKKEPTIEESDTELENNPEFQRMVQELSKSMTYTEALNKAKEEFKTYAKIQPFVNPELKNVIATPSPKEIPQPTPKPEPIPYPNPMPISQPMPLPQPFPNPQYEPKGKQQVKIKIKTPITFPIPPIQFNEDEGIKKKLENGFMTWRQGKTYWAIPQLKDGTFDSNDKVASGKPFIGTTKFYKGKGSVYRTIEYVGKNPPKKAFVDLGWAQYNVSGTTDGDIQLDKVTPDETANWEGVNKYTTPEALAEKREAKRIADVERYRRQYLKQRKPIKQKDVFKEADRLLSKQKVEEPKVVSVGNRTYLGYEILPAQIGGDL